MENSVEVLFERFVSEAVKEVVRREKIGADGDEGLKVMFCSGPEDMVNSTLRAFD